MASIVKGTGVVWSIGGVTFTAGIVSATTTALPQSVSGSRSSEKAEVKDDGGTIATQIYHGFRKGVSITVVPSGTTLALAKTSGDAWLPQPGLKLTLVDAAGTILDGNYNCLSSKQNRTVDGVMTADIDMENGDEGVDLTTTIT